MKEMPTVWVLTGCTESGDDVGPYVFRTKPSVKRMIAVLKRDWGHDWETGNLHRYHAVEVGVEDP